MASGRMLQYVGILHRSCASALLAIGCFLSFATSGVALGVDDDDGAADERKGRYCSATAQYMLRACGYESRDDFYKARAICINISDAAQRKECYQEASEQHSAGLRSCTQQFVGRRQACSLLGEGRYDPAFNPTAFEQNFTQPANPNRYFPLKVGYRWEYRGGDEFNSVEIQNETKLIAGVNCVVMKDRVFHGADLVEDTDDWYAQARSGDIYYCGEEVKDYESFDGDRPRRPELVSRDGSFKWERDGDKGGIFFRAMPKRGDVYREEFSLGNAEDVTEVLAINYSYGVYPELDRFVPQALVKLLCFNDCIVTKNYSLLEPGVFAYKYYARGIGFILEVKPESGLAVQLTSCNFDPRCNILPQP